MFGLFGKTKAVKVRGVKDSRRFGVAARSLKELIRKSCDFLKVPAAGAHMSLASDGTLVTEGVFGSLPDHCELVLLTRGQSWKGVVSDLERLLTSEHREGLVEAVRSLLSGPQSPQRHKLLRDMLRSLEDTSEMETRDQDQDWFTGLDARFKTKSSYMRFNCESRIRSYMKQVSDASGSLEKAQARAEFEKTVQTLGQMLKTSRYQGVYFDRSQKEEDEEEEEVEGEAGRRLCTAEGWFTCQGAFDEALCPSLHSINPYSSRETRVVFSTWNLDHRIEKKRSVVPALLDCHRNRPSADINLTYFYRLLFTTDNLKLVHIACHKKGAHELQCDAEQLYKRRGRAGKQQRGKKRRLR